MNKIFNENIKLLLKKYLPFLYNIYKYILAIFNYQNEIKFLSYQKVKTTYLETAFGMGWAVVKPMVYVLTFWFFFTIGLKSGEPVDGHPFILFLFAGTMPWFLLSEAIVGGTKTITSNAVLIKTIKFPVMALPIIETLSKLYVHIAVMILVFMVYWFNGYPPTIYYINFIYYWFIMLIFLTLLSFILSSISVILRDVQNLIAALMQPLFWLTPVLWHQNGLIDTLEKIFNPLYFFIVGYRDTLLYKKFFWEDLTYDLYMFFILLIMFIFGMRLWNKIRPIMADLI